MAHDIFISYSTKNKQTADAICHVLEQNNLKCWIAPRNIQSGKDYAAEIMDGLRAAKIVVLVFSKDSQASEYVNNEIDTAFSENKPIISFKIDETMPENKMEFFLKNKHWLEAYPNPEAEFERLVKDALSLCEEQSRNRITINTKENTRIDTSNLPKRKNDIISFILLVTPLFGLSFVYMGSKVKKQLWIITGIIYLIPLFLMLLVTFGVFGPTYRIHSLSSMSFYMLIIYWIIAIIHMLIIRKEFLARKTVLDLMNEEEPLFDQLVEQYSKI